MPKIRRWLGNTRIPALLVVVAVGMLSTMTGSAAAAGWLAPSDVPFPVS